MQIRSAKIVAHSHACGIVIRYHGKMPTTTNKKLTGDTPAPTRLVKRSAASVRVLRQFRIVMNAVKTHFRQVEKIAGIGGAQVWALSLIASNPGLSMNDLAQGMDVHQSTASNLVKSLVVQNMIETVKSDSDRRAVSLQILPDGIDVLRKAPAPFTGVLPDALAGLDAQTLARLEKDLGKLIVALNADERAATTLLADL